MRPLAEQAAQRRIVEQQRIVEPVAPFDELAQLRIAQPAKMRSTSRSMVVTPAQFQTRYRV